MGKDKYPIYVVCEGSTQFNQFATAHPDDECIMVFDDTTLRGRIPGIIEIYGTPENRWNYVGIIESVERQKMIWREEFGFDQDRLFTDSAEEGDIYATGFE